MFWSHELLQSCAINKPYVQLTHTFPEDARTSNGTAFWSPPKRFPKPVVFDPADASHASYMQASAILLAEIYGIEKPAWAAESAAVAEKAAAVEVRCCSICSPENALIFFYLQT